MKRDLADMWNLVWELALLVCALPFCAPITIPGLSTPFGIVIAVLFFLALFTSLVSIHTAGQIKVIYVGSMSLMRILRIRKINISTKGTQTVWAMRPIPISTRQLWSRPRKTQQITVRRPPPLPHRQRRNKKPNRR